MSKPVLGYWKLRGLTQPIRFMLAYLEIEVGEKRYGLDQTRVSSGGGWEVTGKSGFFETLDQTGSDDWFKTDKFNLDLNFPNLPYWKEEGLILTESKAIIRYLAREKSKDLMPTNNELLAKADMVESVLYDVWYSLVTVCITYTDEARAKFVSSSSEKLKQLNKFMGSNKFLLGAQLSYVDFILFEMLEQFMIYDSECLKPFPGLVRFKENFEALPAIANYMKSPEFIKSPCFTPKYMAHKI